MRPAFDLVVWDVGGVLNRNLPQEICAGVAPVAADRGHDQMSFKEAVFGSGRVSEIMPGRTDGLEVVAEGVDKEGAEAAPHQFLRDWFEHEATPDPEVGQWLDGCPHRKVIATKNGPRRAACIDQVMGFGTRAETIFSSGRIGTSEPDPAFYPAIEHWSGLPGGRILLVDDNEKHIAGARSRGWSAFHFADGNRHRLPGLLGID